MTHLSPTVSIAITCGSSYTINALSIPTNPQFVTHGDAVVGFAIPSYVLDTHNVACPVNTWELTSSNTGVFAVSGLSLDQSDMVVRPTDIGAHSKYSFYMKITAGGLSGGSNAFFGPYYLDVGCTATSVTFANDPTFLTSGVSGNAKWVGDAVTNAYTFTYTPISSRSYC